MEHGCNMPSLRTTRNRRPALQPGAQPSAKYRRVAFSVLLEFTIQLVSSRIISTMSRPSLSDRGWSADAELDYTATNSGTFTALVRSFSSGGTGTYVLHLAQFPEAFLVPAGDEGGPMAGVTQI